MTADTDAVENVTFIYCPPERQVRVEVPLKVRPWLVFCCGIWAQSGSRGNLLLHAFTGGSSALGKDACFCCWCWCWLACPLPPSRCASSPALPDPSVIGTARKTAAHDGPRSSHAVCIDFRTCAIYCCR